MVLNDIKNWIKNKLFIWLLLDRGYMPIYEKRNEMFFATNKKYLADNRWHNLILNYKNTKDQEENIIYVDRIVAFNTKHKFTKKQIKEISKNYDK